MGLLRKIHDIMCETAALEKSMNVGSGSYSYKAVSEAAVLNEIKPLLKKYGVVILPVGVDVNERVDTFSTGKGESVRIMTQVRTTYKIIDIETGECEMLQSIGNGVDTQDKGSGKALTYAYKAMIQKTFCLFSGEDSDNEHSQDITDRNTKVHNHDFVGTGQVENVKSDVRSDAQVARAYAIAKKNGFTPEQIDKVLKKDYGKGLIANLTKAEYDNLVSRLGTPKKPNKAEEIFGEGDRFK